ncbi:MAG TPA: hypothetical protein PKI03_20405 [Pseudomonadota bacterium]|nr:hypothetical protein [Pseudomonadota bacterium]
MNWLFAHVLSALYPRTAEFPGIADTGLAEFLPRFRRESAPLFRLGFYAAALLFVLTPLFTVFLPLPSFLLPARLLDRHADRITQTSIYPLRSLLLLLKIVAGLCWGVHPEVRARFGLPPLPADPNTWRAS